MSMVKAAAEGSLHLATSFQMITSVWIGQTPYIIIYHSEKAVLISGLERSKTKVTGNNCLQICSGW